MCKILVYIDVLACMVVRNYTDTQHSYIMNLYAYACSYGQSSFFFLVFFYILNWLVESYSHVLCGINNAYWCICSCLEMMSTKLMLVRFKLFVLLFLNITW